MCVLNTDAILHVGSFLEPQDVVALIHVNRDVRFNSNQLLRNQYQKAFGNINKNQLPNKKSIIQLLRFVNK